MTLGEKAVHLRAKPGHLLPSEDLGMPPLFLLLLETDRAGGSEKEREEMNYLLLEEGGRFLKDGSASRASSEDKCRSRRVS